MQSKYEVIGLVGEGSYGVVYKCKNKKTGEFVAIKKFKEEEDEIVKKTISREYKVLQILKHENIVEFKEAFKMKGNLYLVFEYVDKNLLELLQEHPRGLDPGTIKKLIYQLCKAVKYLHDQKIIHRDIKPENLLVDELYRLKLCDFGFARTIRSHQEKLTDYVATRWYRSPELLITSGYYGPEVDYWAIGCIMGELADGDPLFPGDNEIDQLNVIQNVIGRFADHQYDLFYSNPQYRSVKLAEVHKPETLERRYLGKLTKQAILFMKGLLHPDPAQRLSGEAVFSHPYFESFQEPLPANTNINTNLSQTNLNSSILHTVEHNHSRLPINTTAQSNAKFQTTPIIRNTTNINIINYNIDENSIKTDQEKKANASTINQDKVKILEKIGNKSLANNMLMTSYNFNQNLKENILSLYNTTNFGKNLQTFYKSDQYNYDIDLNFLKKKQPDILPHSNHHLNSNTKSKNSDVRLKLEVYNSNSPKNKKKTFDHLKTKTNTTSIVHDDIPKPKYSNLKLATGKGISLKEFQLPYIQHKIYGYKKKH
jgi:cyclin-dependent kinase-like